MHGLFMSSWNRRLTLCPVLLAVRREKICNGEELEFTNPGRKVGYARIAILTQSFTTALVLCKAPELNHIRRLRFLMVVGRKIHFAV